MANLYFTYHLGFIYQILLSTDGQISGDDQNGPNDGLAVVGAIDSFFYSFFIMANLYFTYNLGFKYQILLHTDGRIGGDNQNGPQRRLTHRWGSRYLSFFLFVFYYG
jgi:hypothetical protein